MRSLTQAFETYGGVLEQLTALELVIRGFED